MIPSLSTADSTQAGAGTVAACLRASTRSAHVRIESIPVLAQLTTPDLTGDGYRAALRVLNRFHIAYHSALLPFFSSGAISALFAPSRAITALQSDLCFLGDTTEIRVPALDLPLRDTASALGALYVLEGSALGGRVIGRHVSLALRVGPGRGGEFFCGSTAEQVRNRWRQFCNLLEETVKGEAQISSACESANAAFGKLGQWLAAADTGEILQGAAVNGLTDKTFVAV